MTKARDLANAATALSAVDATELAFVDGVTSAIQTQMDAKAPSSTAVTLTGTQTLTNKTLTSPALTTPTISTATTNGDILYGTGSGALARLGIGTTGQVLNVAAGVPAWATPAASTPTFVGVALSKTNSTSFTSPNYTVIPWNNEQFDTNTFHDNATNNTRITIPSGKAGYYLITAQATISSANTSQSRQLSLWKNGSLASSEYGNVGGYYNGVGQDYSLNFSYTINLAVGDYLEVKYYQNSGVTIPCDQYNNYFTATYLGA